MYCDIERRRRTQYITSVIIIIFSFFLRALERTSLYFEHFHYEECSSVNTRSAITPTTNYCSIVQRDIMVKKKKKKTVFPRKIYFSMCRVTCTIIF